MRVAFSQAAESDLDEIADWFEDRDAEAGLRIVASLRAACADLTKSHGQHRFAVELRRPGLRRRLHRPYLIFYTVTSETVDIVRIIDARRDYARLLR